MNNSSHHHLTDNDIPGGDSSSNTHGRIQSPESAADIQSNGIAVSTTLKFN